MKILVILTYFDRPVLVKGFLRSLLACDRYHRDWELTFVDDGSVYPGRPIAEKILDNRVRYVNTGMDQSLKEIYHGTMIGHCMNEAIRLSDAEVVIFLGDDDTLEPDYLRNLSVFYAANPGILSAYCNCRIFDPNTQRPEDGVTCNADPMWKGHEWFGGPIDCAYKVDGIQVSFRRECVTRYGAAFPFPVVKDHDALFFRELNARCGPSVYTGFLGVNKGSHGGQLIRRINDGDALGLTGPRESRRERLLV